MSTYYPGLDISLSLLYLAVIAWEARSVREFSGAQKIMTVLLWQGPAAITSLIIIAGVHVPVLSNNAIFLLEFWSTPLLPLLSIRDFNFMDKPLYYYLLLIMPALLAAYHYVLAVLPAGRGRGRR